MIEDILLFTTISILIMRICPIFTLIFFDDTEDNIVLKLIDIISTALIIICVILAIICKSRPTAMDVHQGKTTLEITYKDGVPVDSVIVWKGGEK